MIFIGQSRFGLDPETNSLRSENLLQHPALPVNSINQTRLAEGNLDPVNSGGIGQFTEDHRQKFLHTRAGSGR